MVFAGNGSLQELLYNTVSPTLDIPLIHPQNPEANKSHISLELDLNPEVTNPASHYHTERGGGDMALFEVGVPLDLGPQAL